MSSDGPLAFGEDHVWRYDKTKIDKSDAWDHLRRRFAGHPGNHWRKAHTLTHWGWYAVKECNWEDCPDCNPVHLLSMDCKTSQCGEDGQMDPDINVVSCQACIDQHTIIQDRDYCDECGNRLGAVVHAYHEAPFETRSTHTGDPCILCPTCHLLVIVREKMKPKRYTQQEMWDACARILPHIAQIPKRDINIIRAMEMTARHIFVYGVAGDKTTASNIRDQLAYLDKHGETKWPTP